MNTCLIDPKALKLQYAFCGCAGVPTKSEYERSGYAAPV
jgi:hypothetical protein